FYGYYTNMLQLLVTSRARRRLLQLLWGEGARGSAAELAEKAGVGFASAYRELKAMGRYQVVASSHEGGKDVYAANLEHADADVLRRLATSRPRMAPPRDERADTLRRSLRAMGAPLAVEPTTEKEALDEGTLVDGVKLARRDPVVARALPVCVWHQRDRVDPDRLVAAAREKGEKQALGFFLELTGQLSGDRRFARWAKSLRDRRVTSVHDFFDFPAAYGSQKLAKQRTPRVAEKWGFRLNMDLETFDSLFRKFADA